MDLHLFEDNLSDGQKISYGDTIARALYVTAGDVTVDGHVHSYDDGFVSNRPMMLVAGGEGASLWRWDLSEAKPVVQPQHTTLKLSGEIPEHFFGPGNFLRLDSVTFPPSGTAMLHTHHGPGIRCLREGGVRIDTDGASTSFGPGGAWFEIGPLPVFAQANHTVQSRFIRAMVLPDTFRGKSSIRYENEVDRAKPKSQSYRNFGEIGLSL